jgi:PIN domain nuclease of toxin-antitoxin system
VKILLDSHSLIWAVDNPSKLGSHADVVLRDIANEIFVSAATIWELAIKTGLGKLTLSMPYRQWMEGAIVDLNAAVLPITVQYADVQATLPRIHGDPFDRMLVAQSQAEQIALVSNEILLDQYGIVRIW